MERKHISLIVAGCAVMAFLILAIAYTVQTEERMIDSAMELRINASEIGMGWEEAGFGYMSDPVQVFEEACEKLETMKEKLKRNITDEEAFEENLEKDKAGFLELSEKLSEYNVKDGYVLVLQKKDKYPESLVEVDVFVFNDTDGAQRLYNYTVNKEHRTGISDIGDEVAVTLTADIHLVRLSNAFIEVIAWDRTGAGRRIAERIADKVKSRDREMASLEEEKTEPTEPKRSWVQKNSTRFGNSYAYVAGSLGFFGCTWLKSRKAYHCAYGIVVIGETRDKEEKSMKACSAQCLEMEERERKENQTLWISGDPLRIGAWPHEGYPWHYPDNYYEIFSEAISEISNYSRFALSPEELSASFSGGWDESKNYPEGVVREWKYGKASDVAHFFFWGFDIDQNQTISFAVTDYLYGPPDLLRLGKPSYKLPLVWEIEVSTPGDPSKLSLMEMEKYGIKKFSSEYGPIYTANLPHKLKNR